MPFPVLTGKVADWVSDIVDNATESEIGQNAMDILKQASEGKAGAAAAQTAVNDPLGFVMSPLGAYYDQNKDTVDQTVENAAQGSPLIGSLFGDAISGGRSGLASAAGVAGDTPAGMNWQEAKDLINKTAMDNNIWSANQAQINRDFQMYMSNTAHQRELADLKAAGLNPVLTATGGQGASTPSGSMGQTDTSNTSAIADLAMMAIDAVSTTAMGVAGKKTDIWNNYYVKRALGTALSTIARKAITKVF